MQNLRFGDSTLVRGEFSNSYPDSAQLKKFDRTLVWMGEDILILIDQIEAKRESELSVLHRSSALPFHQDENGIHQMASGLSMQTWSEPKGSWKVAKDTLSGSRAPSFYAVHHAKTTKWHRVSVMAPSVWLKDMRSEHSDLKHKIDFSKGNYKIEFSPNAIGEEIWLKVGVRDRTFFELKANP